MDDILGIYFENGICTWNHWNVSIHNIPTSVLYIYSGEIKINSVKFYSGDLECIVYNCCLVLHTLSDHLTVFLPFVSSMVYISIIIVNCVLST